MSDHADTIRRRTEAMLERAARRQPMTWDDMQSIEALLAERQQAQAEAKDLRHLIQASNDENERLRQEQQPLIESRRQAIDALRDLADEAARAVTEPRRFHENENGRQQALSVAVANARSAVKLGEKP